MYTCPHTKRTYDPIHVIRRLHLDSGGKINEWIEARAAGGDGVYANEDAIIGVARKAFNAPNFDSDLHTGYTDEQVLRCLGGFNEYIEKNGVRGQDSPK